MGYLLSVDGGGTKTHFILGNKQGEVLSSYITGSSNYKSVGIENSFENIMTGLEKVCKSIEIKIEDIDVAVFGISGYDSPEDYEVIFNIIKKTGLKKESINLYNDGVLAFYAQADEPGIVIIAGTGSIVLGVDSEGNISRSGGWGYNFSDLGSGYEIGRKALKETLSYCDGCRMYSLLFDKVLAYFEAESFEELPYKITVIDNNYEIANITTLVIIAAGLNDTLAKQILEESARELSNTSISLLDELSKNTDEYVNVVLSGGVFNSELYRNLIIDNLKKISNNKKLKFTFQENDPVYGGLKLARKLLT